MHIEIVYALNDRYAVGAAVSICSLCKNSDLEQAEYTVNIVYSNLLDSNISRLKETVSGYKIRLNFVKVDVSDFIDPAVLYDVNYLTIEMYFRLLTARLFPNLDKVLYIDCDTVVCRDLFELYSTDVSDCILAAVNDIPNIPRSRQLELIGLDKNTYFNSGLLLLNLKKFRECSVLEKTVELLENNRDLICPDQDALNFICGKEIIYLDDRWNFQWGHYLDKYVYLDELSCDRYKRAQADFFILHFTSPRKPWNSVADIELSAYFWKYAACTPFWHELFSFLVDENIPAYYSDRINSIMEDNFRDGKVGFRYILKFIRGWTIHKIKKQGWEKLNERNT